MSEVYDTAATQKLVADLKASGGPYCSFCGMDKEHAGHLTEGPTAHICQGCAELVAAATIERLQERIKELEDKLAVEWANRPADQNEF